MRKLSIITLLSISHFCALKAQSFNIKSIQAKASWSLGGIDRVVFESHSMRNIAQYDSFPSALDQFLTDAEKSNLNLDSMESPISIHYMVFDNGKRKLTVENPEYLNNSFNPDEEWRKNQDSLPTNVIRIYDTRFDVVSAIYLEHTHGVSKLKKVVEFYRDSAQIPTWTQLDIPIPFPNLNLVIFAARSACDYGSFQKSLQSTVKINRPPRLNGNLVVYNYEQYLEFNKKDTFYEDGITVESNNLDTNYVLRVTRAEIPIFQPIFSHLSMGFLGNNLCGQVNVEVPFRTNFVNNLPKNLAYLSVGSTVFSERSTNSNYFEVGGILEGLIGLKTTNVSPDLKSSADFRVSGLEMGLYVSAPMRSFLYNPGWVIKSYKQWGNFRLTTGFYASALVKNSEAMSSALLLTFEVFDWQGVYQTSVSKRGRVKRN